MTNYTIMQYFEWYYPEGGKLWKQCAEQAAALAQNGINTVWLPPAYKGANGGHDVGYAVYDLYDLGEFDQKGSVPTKYGTKDEYLAAVRAFHDHGISVLADIVFNQRIGADGSEEVLAQLDDSGNRTRVISGDQKIRVWTRFNFPGRHGKYSDFTWNWTHFTGVDWDDNSKRGGVYRFAGKQWSDQVDTEKGNFDYLMGADVDVSNPEVVNELARWGKWYLQTTGVDGFRLDAVKHIKFSFLHEWLNQMRGDSPVWLPAVGEYWSPDVSKLQNYLAADDRCMGLFDVPLHFKLYQASHGGGYFDMRTLLDGTLVAADPEKAVTFVDNHDTQPGQALGSWVDGWFKPLAYALILLRQQGTPCVFYGDYYGIPHDNISPVSQLPALIRLRYEKAYGEQKEYFDHADIIGWVRQGDDQHPDSGLAILLSDGPGGGKRMHIGARFAGRTLQDAIGHSAPVTVDADGWADFRIEGGTVSVWTL